MTEADLDRAGRFEAEAQDLDRRSRAAATLPASILPRFQALWKAEAAKLLRQRKR
ncbi:hypothetical protein V8F63_15465 [Brevundimonas sp. LF-1]|uniref:hypothetical protein n=1 Tax=Brevundimonas sp. LF-1 TaxID=3126100 RepID=UPI0030E12FDC